MKIDVGENIVEPIIRDQIAAAVAAHLGDPEDIVQRLVSVALKTKTNENGVVSQNGYDNKHDFLEALASKAIREAAHPARIGRCVMADISQTEFCWLMEDHIKCKYGSLRNYARQLRLSPSYVSAVKNGKKTPNQAILNDMGIKMTRHVIYRFSPPQTQGGAG